MKKRILGALVGAVLFSMASFTSHAYDSNFVEMGERGRPWMVTTDSNEQIRDEIREGEMELIAQLVQAEAGNQDMEGKRRVVDVVLNRVDDPRFPNTVEEVIFQKGQFQVVEDGAWEKAGWNMQESDYEAVSLEYDKRSDYQVLYFCAGGYINGTTPLYKLGGHYFSR